MADNPFGNQAHFDDASTAPVTAPVAVPSAPIVTNSLTPNPFGSSAHFGWDDGSNNEAPAASVEPSWKHMLNVAAASPITGVLGLFSSAANVVPHWVTESNNDMGTNYPKPYQEISPYVWEDTKPKTNAERYIAALGGGATVGGLGGAVFGGGVGAIPGALIGATTGVGMQALHDGIDWLDPGFADRHPLTMDAIDFGGGALGGKVVTKMAPTTKATRVANAIEDYEFPEPKPLLPKGPSWSDKISATGPDLLAGLAGGLLEHLTTGSTTGAGPAAAVMALHPVFTKWHEMSNAAKESYVQQYIDSVKAAHGTPAQSPQRAAIADYYRDAADRKNAIQRMASGIPIGDHGYTRSDIPNYGVSPLGGVVGLGSPYLYPSTDSQ